MPIPEPEDGPLARARLHHAWQIWTVLGLSGLGGLLVVLAGGGLVAGATGAGLAGWLAWLALVDVERFLLPDVLTLPLLMAGLGLATAQAGAGLIHHAAGAAAGFALIWGVDAVHRLRTGRPGIGLGDAKLLAAAGAWLGWMDLPGVLVVASGAGLAWTVGLRLASRTAPRHIPFGPFLAAGFWGVWYFRTAFT